MGGERLTSYLGACGHIHAYIHTYIHTHIHTWVHVATYMRTYIHTYIHTYIPGCMWPRAALHGQWGLGGIYVRTNQYRGCSMVNHPSPNPNPNPNPTVAAAW